MNTDQTQYYALCAAGYDSYYDLPERADDLDELHERVAELLSGHSVLEIACGTGYWTDTVAETAESVLAIDNNPAMLALARARGLDADVVEFSLADGFNLPAEIASPGRYTACFAAGWWSLVKREDQERYLAQLRLKLGKDVLLVLLDSSYVDGITDVIARTDLEGNTFQIRTAPNGERFEVIENFPSDSTLRKRFAASARNIRVDRMEHFWLLTCRLK